MDVKLCSIKGFEMLYLSPFNSIMSCIDSVVSTYFGRVHSMIEKLAQFTDMRCCLVVGGLSSKVIIFAVNFCVVETLVQHDLQCFSCGAVKFTHMPHLTCHSIHEGLITTETILSINFITFYVM